MKTRVSASVLAVLLLAVCHPAAANFLDFLRNAVSDNNPTFTASPRILGGKPVQDHCKAPFNSVAHIKEKQSSGLFTTICTGTLLAPDIVVSAASCLYVVKARVSFVYVTLGDRDAELVDLGGPNRFREQTIQVAALKFHSGYNLTGTPAENQGNNIVLLKLKTAAVMDQYCVQPMARYDSSAAATPCDSLTANCTILGWGATSSAKLEMYFSSAVLQYGFVDVLTSLNLINLVMANKYAAELPLREGITMIGSGFPGTNVGVCRYDQGSMLACPNANGTMLLRGILANNDKCARSPLDPPPNRPMYFTDVEYYKNWLESCQASFSDPIACPGQNFA